MANIMNHGSSSGRAFVAALLFGSLLVASCSSGDDATNGDFETIAPVAASEPDKLDPSQQPFDVGLANVYIPSEIRPGTTISVKMAIQLSGAAYDTKFPALLLISADENFDDEDIAVEFSLGLPVASETGDLTTFARLVRAESDDTDDNTGSLGSLLEPNKSSDAIGSETSEIAAYELVLLSVIALPVDLIAGDHYAAIRLDPDDLVAEANEQNNLSDTIAVTVVSEQPVAVSLPPAIAQTAPLADALLVDYNSQITLTFDKAMDGRSIDSTSFQVSQGTAAIAGDIFYHPDNRTAAFTPKLPLKEDTVYSVMVTDAVLDAEGLAITAYTWQFRTKKQYHLSATVSGVAGYSISISNDQQQTLAIVADGSYLFNGAYFTGGSYSVSLETVPDNLNCSLEKSSGTFDNGDISDVRIQCSDTNPEAQLTYILGGNVSGLVGSMTLVNGDDSLVVSQNGAFNFTAKLSRTESYMVVVSETSHNDAGYECAIENGQGIMRSGDVTNVVVHCGSGGYRLGGMVNGLYYGEDDQGNRLYGSVVLVNGSDSKTVSTDGSFWFDMELQTGDSFEVIVDQNPIGQSCVVASPGDSGIIGESDVSDVQISCTGGGPDYDVPYTVSGQVSGLSGTLLVEVVRYDHDFSQLDNEQLSLPADGSYSSKLSFYKGQSYNLSISQHPTGQYCLIANQSAVIADNNVSNADITCNNRFTADATVYSVGGAVTGLATADTTLKITLLYFNADSSFSQREEITVTGDGVFVFDAGLYAAESFQVLPSQQPSNQICLISFGKGIITAADVSNVSIACGSSVDLQISAIEPSANLITGDNVTLSVTLENAGDVAVPSVLVNIYLSTSDSLETASDLLLASEFVSSIADGSTAQADISFLLPGNVATGEYYFHLQVDANDEISEGDETNNVFLTSTKLSISNQSPDLVPTTIDYTSQTDVSTIEVSFSLQNPTEYAIAADLSVKVYLYERADFLNIASATLIGSDTIAGGLAAGGLHSVTLSGLDISGYDTGISQAPYLWLVVDEGQVIIEVNEGNNELVGEVVNIP